MPLMTAADKSEICKKFDSILDRLFHATSISQNERDIEKRVAASVMALGADLLASILTRQCAEDTESALATHGYRADEVSFRRDKNYQARLTSVFGPIVVCLGAFYSPDELFGPVGSVIVPSQERTMIRYPACRSTLLCLEWEARLGADHPFRMAQEQLTYFTHGAVSLEDNTIAKHMVNASQSVDASWLYKSPAQIAEILRERALRDGKTQRPVVYISSDAHALRRYTDETWSRQWKMVNGVRIWAVDRFTGENVHLGGQFTWGDCEKVTAIFAGLIQSDILPEDGIYEGVEAQYVWIADGAPWFSERIIPLFRGNIIQILDVYHALEHASKYADLVLPKSERRAWKDSVRDALLISKNGDSEVQDEGRPGSAKINAEDHSDSQRKNRKGHKKNYDKTRAIRDLETRARHAAARLEAGTPAENLARLIPTDESIDDSEKMQAHEAFTQYVGKRIDQMDYFEMQSRYIQVGSGAMESLHKTGSQIRLKRAGVTCLAETSQAILDLRMLRMAGRWEEFWSQPNLSQILASNWVSARKTEERQTAA